MIAARGIRLACLLIAAVWALAGAVAAANPRLLVNANTGDVLYAEDAGLPWHPASLTKLMTAYVAFEAIALGRVSLTTPVTISRTALDVPPSRSGLKLDTTISLEDALYILLVKSANDVAIAVAETISGSERRFVAEMNAAAQNLGLTATHYANAHGLHDPAQITSARDLAVLALVIRGRYPQYLPIFATETVRIGALRLETNNELLTKFAGTTGMKTGYVCASGLNIVATFERGGASLMAVVLGSSSARERGEMAADMVLRALSGGFPPTGARVTQIANDLESPPANMRSRLCGKEAAAYVAEREAAFALGLRGQPSHLTDRLDGPVHVAVDLGRLRDVPLPRRRPAYN